MKTQEKEIDKKIIEEIKNFEALLIDKFETHKFKPNLAPIPEQTQPHRSRC